MIKKKICILGSTGSIGLSTLDVIARNSDQYEVFALTAHQQVEKLAQQCQLYHPQIAVVGTEQAAATLRHIFKEKNIETTVLFGAQALCDVASAAECDIVMAAIVGAAGLPASLAAAKAGKKILLANKEALVMSGELFINTVKENRATLLPIDSEHNAIFQCLPHNYNTDLKSHSIQKIILTASGGPFLNRDVETLNHVTPEQAIAHPNWSMGRKISVDSATMMNKGLEVIEAHWLFNAPAEAIEVLIHPQSVVHSMVSYSDGSVLAQMGNPDMRTPIAYGLAYPDRIDSGVAPLDLTSFAQLSFQKPDFDRFPCLRLAYEAMKSGKSAATILNASNEIAVEAFLNHQLSFRQIDQVIAAVLDEVTLKEAKELDAIMECDQEARSKAREVIQKLTRNRH
jgi:1-deoxy-D-xylulose-5-phosphate reductoisomerase